MSKRNHFDGQFLTPAIIPPLKYLAALAVKSWRVPEEHKDIYDSIIEEAGSPIVSKFSKVKVSAEWSEDTKMKGGYVISRKIKKAKIECDGPGGPINLIEDEFKY